MPYTDPLAPLTAAGLVVTLTPDRRLNVRPSALLTDDLREYIRLHRDAIIGALAAPSTGPYGGPPPPRPTPPTLGLETTSGLREAVPPAFRSGLEHYRWDGTAWTTSTNGVD